MLFEKLSYGYRRELAITSKMIKELNYKLKSKFYNVSKVKVYFIINHCSTIIRVSIS